MSYSQTGEFAHGTSLQTRGPWSVYSGGRALCPDGKVRSLSRISICADTFFSVPAAVKAKGKTVSGYVTTHEDSLTGRPFVEFVPHDIGKNADIVFPRRPFIAVSDLEWAAKHRDIFSYLGKPYWASSKETRF